MPRQIAIALAVLLALVEPVSAQMPFGVLTCSRRSGVLFCQGDISTRVPSFDGVPIDLNVTLPSSGSRRDLPLIILSHGYSENKDAPDVNLSVSAPLALLGYAVLAISARGFGNSCGSPASRSVPACGNSGWVHLDDARFELRDVQYFAGLLVDQGIVNPKRIGFVGGSYGGGLSMEAAVLKDRIMDTDGTLKPWTSPKGKKMQAAAAVPIIGWSDLVYALAPNGRTLDYTITGTTDDLAPIGVMKQSFVTSLYNLGLSRGFYAPGGDDPDLTAWFNAINGGEPYDGNPEVMAIESEVPAFHSPYYFDDSEPPAPALIINGWTDDLFPADEALRFYNRTRQKYPGAPIALMFLDFGHPRGQNKPADFTRLEVNVVSWLSAYLKGNGRNAMRGVQVLTETCPQSAKSGGPFSAPNWVAIHPGEVRLVASDTQSFTSDGGDSSIAGQLDPIGGGGACVTVSSNDEANTANWRLPAATGKGYTLIGAPTVSLDLTFTGNSPEITARLWDVSNGTQTLVARGIYRPDANGPQVFQLHPAAWHFAAGHLAKLQLLGRDPQYARASNGSFSISVSNLDLRLPVHDMPDCKQVMPPAPPIVPDGATLAPDVKAAGGRACRTK